MGLFRRSITKWRLCNSLEEEEGVKVLLVNTFYYPEVKGGAEYSVKKLAETLHDEGNEVVVLAAGNTDSEAVLNGVRIIRRRFWSLYHSYGQVRKNIFKKVTHRLLDFWNPLNKKILDQVIKDIKPDVIHTNNLYEITPIIWRIARKNGVSVVHTIRDYYLMCIKTNLLKKDNSLCVNPNIGCVAYQAINRRFTKYVDVLTAPSEMMIREVESRKFFLKSQRTVVYNACEFNRDQVVANCTKKQEHDTVTFVYLGGLHAHKGIETLLEAFQNVENPCARLIFAGKGEKEQNVKEACSSDNKIAFAGFLNESEVNQLLKKGDVLVCPSLWNEPFGRVVLDAYENGLPVIASRIGALPEIVRDKETGILVEPGSSMELQKAMEYCLDKRNFLEYCRNNLPNQLEKFSLERQVSSFKNIYKQLLKETEI